MVISGHVTRHVVDFSNYTDFSYLNNMGIRGLLTQDTLTGRLPEVKGRHTGTVVGWGLTGLKVCDKGTKLIY